jgi:hypothetical protein
MVVVTTSSTLSSSAQLILQVRRCSLGPCFQRPTSTSLFLQGLYWASPRWKPLHYGKRRPEVHTNQFWRLRNKKLHHIFQFYSQHWRAWAVCFAAPRKKASWGTIRVCLVGLWLWKKLLWAVSCDKSCCVL